MSRSFISKPKVASVVGARPQFIKAAPVSRALRQTANEVLIHTGQHYDHGLSAVFFEELSIPEPDYHLGVGSGSHGWQTGQMLIRLEETLLIERPDWALWPRSSSISPWPTLKPVFAALTGACQRNRTAS